MTHVLPRFLLLILGLCGTACSDRVVDSSAYNDEGKLA